MFDAEWIAAPSAQTQPRAYGEARIAARRAYGRDVLDGLRQRGSAKALLPRGDGAAGLDAVLLNTAGGITGGDRFSYGGTARADARLTLTTQAAERAYRAQPGEVGRVETRLVAEAGARIDWLPQETILFEGSALERRLEVDLADDATLFAIEPLVFGRAAMGERLTDARFFDSWRVRRDGRLIFADGFRLDRDARAALDGPAALAGMGAAALALYAGRDAEALAPAARLLASDGGPGGASAFDGKLVVRMAAEDGYALHRRLIPLIEALRGAPPPKVWTM